MDIEPFPILLGLVAGLFLGGLFFGGLRWTVRRGVASERAALWFAGSFFVRFVVLAAGLYLLAHDSPTRGVAAAIGLIIARFVAARAGASVPSGGRVR